MNRPVSEYIDVILERNGGNERIVIAYLLGYIASVEERMNCAAEALGGEQMKTLLDSLDEWIKTHKASEATE